MSEQLELTVLIPALNEADSLPTVLAHVREVVEELTQSFEILVVDGGSKDDTVARAEKAGARVIRQKGKGFGSAVREGLQDARGSYIISMDGDGSHPASIFRDLWQRRQGAQLIVASRYMKGGSAVMPRFKHFLSLMLNWVSNWYLDLPVHDSSSGLRLYEAAAVRALPLRTEDFTVQQETMVRVLAAGGKVEEVPFHYAPRIGGESKADIPLLARRYIKMLYTLKQARGGLGATGAGLGVLLLGLVTGLWGLGWGLPGPQRLRAFPPSVAQDQLMPQKLADGWARLYAAIRRSHDQKDAEEPVTYLKGYQEVPAGWSWPPDILVNSLRSALLQAENPDEKKSFIILGQMRPWKLEFKPLYIHYGGAFIYPLGAFLKAASLLGAVRLVPDMRYYLAHPEEMGRLYYLGRLFMLLAHLGSLLLLFSLGKRLSGWPAGLAAAALFALAPMTVVNTHILKPHAYAAFFVLAAVSAMLCAKEKACLRASLLCGVLAGLAAGANLSLLPIVALPLLLLAAPRMQRGAILGAVAAVLTCLALNPYLLFSFKDFLWETQVYAPAVFSLGLDRFTDLWRTAVGGLGLLLAATAFAGAAGGLFRPGRRTLAAVVWGLGSFLWFRFSGFASDTGSLRLYYPLVALAVVLGVDLLWSAPKALRWALLLAALADTGLRGGVYLHNMSLDSGPDATRVLAAEYIDKLAPAGATVGLVRFPDPAHVPPFRLDRYKLVFFSETAAIPKGKEPAYVVVDGGGRTLVDSWAQKDYDCVAEFVPAGAFWARLTDESSFINNSFFIYRRKT